jgi:ornithine cyclodeaminase/alanine dehydrogenase
MTHPLLYLSRDDVESVGITMAEVITAVEAVFLEKGKGLTEMPPKPGIHPGPPDSFIHAMPAYVPAMKSAGLKWVSAFPENQRRGLPYITGLLILNDADTGLPLSVMDGVWMTGMRTGAATALSAKFLARSDSAVVGVLGCGVQGRTNVEALSVLFPLKKVMAYDVNEAAQQDYIQDIGRRLDLEVIKAKTAKDAVTHCDIIVTAGPILKEPHATIQPGWMDTGAFASLVDYDAYWHPDAMAETTKFCTDDTAQLMHYRKMGYLRQIPDIYADLGELVTGAKIGRQRADERTMTVNLGLAIEDMAVAPLIFKKAKEKNIGTWLTL